MVRWIALGLVFAVSTPACTASRAAMAGGVATMIAGGVMMTSSHTASQCTDPGSSTVVGQTVESGLTSICNGVSESSAQTADAFEHEVGGALFVVGAVLAVIGVIGEERSHPAEAPPAIAFAPAPPRPPVAAATPAELAIRSRVENRLAIQASMAARAGYCSSAIATAERLAIADHDLYLTLREADAQLASCYALAPPPAP